MAKDGNSKSISGKAFKIVVAIIFVIFIVAASFLWHVLSDNMGSTLVLPNESSSSTAPSSDVAVSSGDLPQQVEALALENSEIALGKNLTFQLKANRTDVTWSSSNPQIANVDESGSVNGVNVGECSITATDSLGNSVQCTVCVKKVCYLTLDDGPNENTEDILNVLKEYDVKATFFVVSSNKLDLTKQMQEQGCLVGMHTYSHTYEVCYKNYYSYYRGLEKLGEKIKKYTGSVPTVIRFPGGTHNTQCDDLTMRRILNGAKDLGYVPFDWTATAGDTSPKASSDYSLKNVKKTCTDDVEIILMHDKKINVYALKQIIPYLKECGYIFETLDKNPESYTFTPRYRQTLASKNVSVNKKSVTIKKDNTVKLTAKLTPYNSTDYVRWESADPSIAKVNADGIVTGLSKGTVKITAITSSGKQAVCEITVK